jgi:hypothetical protein
MIWALVWLYLWGAVVTFCFTREISETDTKWKDWAIASAWPVLVPAAIVSGLFMSVVKNRG